MKPIYLRKKQIFLCLLLSFILFFMFYPKAVPVNSQAREKHVLFISSYSENFITVPEEITGIRSVFSPKKIQLDVEYMDTKRFDTKQNRKLFYELLKYKLHHLKKYDAIIVGDDNALQFALDYQEELFSEIPIVFFGVNDYKRAESAEKKPYITGIIEEMSLKDNVKLGLQFNPYAKRVVAIVDDTLTGQGDKAQFYAIKEQFKQLKFEDINFSKYSIEEVKEVLDSLGKDTILIYLSMYIDKYGTNLTIPEAVDILREHTDIPILRAQAGGVGEGILGGKMVSYLDSGKMAAHMVLKILDGTSADSIPIKKESPYRYIFDYKLLKKYNIDKQLIAKDAVFVNKKVSFFEQYRDLVLNTLSFLGFLIVVLIILFIDNLKRRRIEKALQESNEELTQTFEELTASEEELRAQYDTIQKHASDIEILNQKYSIAIESTDSAVWEYNALTDEVYISQKFLNDYNVILSKQAKAEDVLELLLSEETRNHILEEFRRYESGLKTEINIEIPVYDKDNNKRWVLVRGREFTDVNDNVRIVRGILLDITKMKEQEEYIEFFAGHDYLTKIPNRMAFMDKLEKELKSGKKGAILLLDIDNFKGLNDTLGHMYGDKMLTEIAERLSGMVSDSLFVSRFGGDEFLILISGAACESEIETVVVNLMKLFDEPLYLNYKEYFIQFSIGISCYPKDSENIDQLLMHVDTAMYHVKRSGKNNYLFYDGTMMKELKDRTEIEAVLRKALKEDGFVLAYQPQVNVNTGNIDGFEALLRLKYHRIPPLKFITIAEETGLILDIGRWVTKEVILQIAEWKEKGHELKPVAINFSSKQIRDTEYIEFLKECLTANQVDPQYLEIEITESILMEKTDTTIDFLNELKNIGMRIALDDFGTGYSSLNYLTFIPVDKIKLDKTLCEKFLGMENLKAMNSLISLVHSLKLTIIAEGIEDVDQYNRLKTGGCDMIQGYLFSKPLFQEEIEEIYDCNLLYKIN